MEDYYLTESLFVRDKTMYYLQKGVAKPLKNHNWHHFLDEIGWTKLPKGWIQKLNMFLPKPKNNSLFGCLDCGGDGDCFFHCLSFALDNEMDAKKLRKQLSESICEETFEEMKQVYIAIEDSFEESWNPQTITFEEFKEKIKQGGNEYWGDSYILNLIREMLQINIYVLYSNESEKSYYNYPLFYEYDPSKQTVVLLYEDEIHFQLIGYFLNGMMTTLFTDEMIPQELRELLKIR